MDRVAAGAAILWPYRFQHLKVRQHVLQLLDYLIADVARRPAAVRAGRGVLMIKDGFFVRQVCRSGGRSGFALGSSRSGSSSRVMPARSAAQRLLQFADTLFLHGGQAGVDFTEHIRGLRGVQCVSFHARIMALLRHFGYLTRPTVMAIIPPMFRPASLSGASSQRLWCARQTAPGAESDVFVIPQQHQYAVTVKQMRPRISGPASAES